MNSMTSEDGTPQSFWIQFPYPFLVKSLLWSFATIYCVLNAGQSQAQARINEVGTQAVDQVSVSSVTAEESLSPKIVKGERLSDWLLRDHQAEQSPAQQQTPEGNPKAPFYLGSSWLTPVEIPDQAKAKQNLLDSLDKIPFPVDDPAALQTKASLTRLIDSMSVTGRVVLPNTNPRFLQANPKQDPILRGNEKVVVPITPQSVTVIRNNGTLCQIAYRPHIETRVYLEGCALKGKDRERQPDWAWLVEPNGSVHQVPTAAWNAAQQIFPAPGSWIWAPPRYSEWTSAAGEAFSKNLAQFLGTQGPSGLPQSPGINESQIAYLPRLGPREIYSASRNLPISNNLWGETGLLQVPSARVAPAGTGSASLALWQPYGTVNLGFAPLDWFEFAVRYTNINNVPYGSQELAGGQSYKDKSAGVKFRVWEESAYIPQIAVGIRDIAGTGLFSSEYAVASKRYNDFDLSLGVGWGQLGTRNNMSNPMSIFGSSFKTRPAPTVGQGGTVNTGALFHGTSALIGGVQYHTPWDPLVLKLELDGNSYQQTPQPDLPFGQNLTTKTMFNFGATYQGSFWDVTVGLRGGQQVMFALNLHDRIDLLSTPKVAQAKPVTVALKPVGSYDPVMPEVLASNSGNVNGVIGFSQTQSATKSQTQAALKTNLKASVNNITNPSNQNAQDIANRAIKKYALEAQSNKGLVSQNGGGIDLNTPSTMRGSSSLEGGSANGLREASQLTAVYHQTLLDFEAQTQWKVSSLSAQGDVWTLNLQDASGIFIRNRLARGVAVMHRDAPSQIQYFEIRLNNWGMLVSQYRINRKDWMLAETQLLPPSERHPTVLTQNPSAYSTLWSNRSLPSESSSAPPLSNATEESLGKTLATLEQNPLQTNLGVSYNQIVGGPNTPLLFALGAKGDASYKFRENTWVTGTVNARVLDNFGKYTYQPPPDGLYPVRTNIRQYMTTSVVTMPNLQVTNAGQLGGNHFASVYAGYLEMMFAGAGAEYLWRPVDSSIALGANINRVYQRQFNQWTSFQNYKVNTGFVTGYWDTGVQDILVKLSLGQYLAGDRGGTLDLSRVFQNGVKIGAYATRTNVSYSAFGEGSFDKGLYVTVPFDAFFARNSDSTANLLFTPLIRDGGAMLFRKYQLYDMTRTRDSRALSFGPD
ncbi:YjbH domain-containing protein [Polynucleobacter sp. JS-JIR-II-b4]|uniref:YjbH domain-containing protein n=1 Tax=Polynucleobacter sp. JS-JIR-II-b4 TaxID=1758390 RepID=UPI001BFD8820|nr:YjbH domain-containing protein [Polynucleobacter sp. JS-JIR-II-b4]QWE02835.1 YjbH domain-containing protein [Polynucleobacter sp. JS-JIR-II-b4]